MGKILIYIAFTGALFATASYLTSHFTNSIKLVKYGRLFYHLMAVFTIASAAFMLYLILTHQFQYTYVWGQSSRDLPLNLLIATFYAGQEGSFHLWALWMSIIGLFLLGYTSKMNKDGTGRYEVQVMGIFALLQTFLLFILIIKSPYNFVWETYPNDVQYGFIPPDGRGLNPLLQNFWMSIHPPILFTGFSSMAVPFCFAIAALMKNEYDRWVKLALPWTLFASMVLGFGIMLGGYWAYGVLGWGGYWGWDPVENSSFVPWITMIASFHIMITQNRTGGFKKTSLFLCIMAYILVLYSTFLTRSGILGDASVHSFVDPGQEVYFFLIVFLGLFTLLGFGLIIFRFRSLKNLSPSPVNILSRESALFTGSVTLCAAALVILVGTSWPILAKGTVEPGFYNKMNLPIAILISFINGLSILMKWKYSEEKQFLKKLIIPLVLTSAVTIILVIIGIRDFLIALFAASALFAFFINGETALNRLRKNRIKAGPYIAHVGIALLFLGIIGSSRYSEEVNVALPLNESKDALGYKLTYVGATPIPGHEDRYHFNVIVEKDGRQMYLQPVMYYSDYSEGVMKNPDIANLVTKDVYLSPLSLEVPEDFTEQDVTQFKKGEEKEIKGVKIKFIDFDMTGFNREELKNKENVIGAQLKVEAKGKKEDITVKTKYYNGMPEYTASAFTDKYNLYLVKTSVQSESSIDLAVVDKTQKKSEPQQVETLMLAASIKPYINLVWGGTLILVAGFFLSILKRKRNLLN